MTSLHFFAADQDVIRIAEYLIERDFQIYESQSALDSPIREFKSAVSIWDAYNISEPGNLAGSLNLAIYSPTFAGKILFSQDQLLPEYTNGASFRTTTEGWGLIRLDLGGAKSGRHLRPSRLSHNSKKRALLWQDTYPRLDDVELWNWDEVESDARKMIYHIKSRLAVNKIGSAYLLPCAERLRASENYELAGM